MKNPTAIRSFPLIKQYLIWVSYNSIRKCNTTIKLILPTALVLMFSACNVTKKITYHRNQIMYKIFLSINVEFGTKHNRNKNQTSKYLPPIISIEIFLFTDITIITTTKKAINNNTVLSEKPIIFMFIKISNELEINIKNNSFSISE